MMAKWWVSHKESLILLFPCMQQPSIKEFVIENTSFGKISRHMRDYIVLLVCSKLEWHKTLSLDILMFIATLYSHCWGVLDNLATLGTVNVQVVHMWRHASKITRWCICEIDSRRQCLTARSIRGLRPISSRTVRNRLRERHIRPRRPAICPILLPRYRAARLAWCRRHLKFRRQDWANILFRDESRFHLDSSDGRSEFTGA